MIMNGPSYARALKAVAKVLKKKFTNMTVDETIDLASEVLAAVVGSAESDPSTD